MSRWLPRMILSHRLILFLVSSSFRYLNNVSVALDCPAQRDT
jgi:hypothetical protein